MKFAELISIIAFVYCLSLLYNVLKVTIYELDGTIQPLNNWDQMDTNKLIFTHMFVHLVFFFSTEFCFKRCLLRSALMCFILGVSELIPKFGLILSLIGGSTITLLTFVFPCLFYLRLEQNISLHIKVLLYEIIAIGLFGGVASTYSAINAIRKEFTK